MDSNFGFPPRLVAKVAAKNKCHMLANALTVELFEALKPLVGKKVIKTDGSLLESVCKIINLRLSKKKKPSK